MELLVLAWVVIVATFTIDTIRSGNRMQARNRRIRARRLAAALRRSAREGSA